MLKLEVKLNRVLTCLLFIALSACSADPAEKKIPNIKGEEIVSSLNYFTDVKIDILLVVDNSGSMEDYQDKFVKGLDDFTDLFYRNRFLDFHIGVVTSDDDRLETSRLGRSERFVDRKTVNGEDVLRHLLDVGTSGGGSEKFFSISIDALTPPRINSHNKNFLRDDAHLAVFFLTDTDDHSGYTAEVFVESFLDLKSGRADKLTLVGGLLPENSTCQRHTQEIPPEKLEEAVRILKGETLDICADNFGEDLARIAGNIFANISTVALRELPDPETILVKFGSQTIPNSFEKGWTYNPKENKIYLGSNLDLKEEPDGTKLQITFKTRVD